MKLTVKDLIDLGYGGYAGWSDEAAEEDFRKTGGAGKYTGFVKKEVVLKDFIKKHNGEFCDYDKKNGPQCVDLIREYLKFIGYDAYDLAPVKYAKQLYLNFSNTEKFTVTKNGASNYPSRGAIVVFKPYLLRYGIAGHVAIVNNGNTKNMEVFEQNYPTGSACRLAVRDYGWFGNAVYGWITPKIIIK